MKSRFSHRESKSIEDHSTEVQPDQASEETRFIFLGPKVLRELRILARIATSGRDSQDA